MAAKKELYMKKTLPVIAVLLIALLAFTGCEPGNTPEPDVWSAITNLDQLVGTWKYIGVQNCSFNNGQTSYEIPVQITLVVTKSGTQYSAIETEIMTLPNQDVLEEAQSWWTERGVIDKFTIDGLKATCPSTESFSRLEDAAHYKTNQYGNKLNNTRYYDWIYIKQ